MSRASRRPPARSSGATPRRPRPTRRSSRACAAPARSSSARPTWSSSPSAASASTRITARRAVPPIRSRVPGGSTSGGAVSVGEGTSDITIGSRHRRLDAHPGGLQRRRRLQADGAPRAARGRLPACPTRSTRSARSPAPCSNAPMPTRSWPARSLARSAFAPSRACASACRAGACFRKPTPMVAGAFEASLGDCRAAGARVADHDIEDLLAGLAEATASGLARRDRGRRGP